MGTPKDKIANPCSACGSRSEPDSVYCDQCGQQLPEKLETTHNNARRASNSSSQRPEAEWEAGSSKRMLISFLLAGGGFLGVAYLSLFIFEPDVQAIMKGHFAVPSLLLVFIMFLAIWPGKKFAPTWPVGVRIGVTFLAACSLYGIVCLIFLRFP